MLLVPKMTYLGFRISLFSLYFLWVSLFVFVITQTVFPMEESIFYEYVETCL